MIRALIIDDEQNSIQRLARLLKDHLSGEVHLMETFSTYSEGVAAIEKYRPELVFLDVQLDGGRTAFDLLKEITATDVEIIFITAYEKYAVKAFRFSALDYLLKPIVAEELKQAVRKLSERNPKVEITKKLETLLGNLYNKEKKICVSVSSGIVVLNVDDIIRCEAEINYTTIFLKDKHKITVARTLKDFEELLSDYNFCRIHNSHLVNLGYLRSYNKGKGGSVVLTDGKEIEVSTRRKEEFIQRMGKM
jgi:two-component system LytT family response regulator